MHARKVVMTALLCGLVLLPPAASRLFADQQPVVTDAVAKLVEGRDQAKEYVVEIKRKFKPDDQQYQRARDLYVDALSKNNAWIAIVSTAIRNGKTKKLANDEAYQSAAKQADQATKEFTNYAKSTRAVTNSRFVFAPVIGLGVAIFDAIQGHKKKERTEEADRFEKEVYWSGWEDIHGEM
jgi:hypothetical protein